MASLLCLCCFWSLFSIPAQSHNRQRTSLYWSERTELLVPPFAALFIFDGFFAPLPLHGELRYRSRSCANPLFSQSAFDVHILYNHHCGHCWLVKHFAGARRLYLQNASICIARHFTVTRIDDPNWKTWTHHVYTAEIAVWWQIYRFIMAWISPAFIQNPGKLKTVGGFWTWPCVVFCAPF